MRTGEKAGDRARRPLNDMSIYRRKAHAARKNGKYRYTVVIEVPGEAGRS